MLLRGMRGFWCRWVKRNLRLVVLGEEMVLLLTQFDLGAFSGAQPCAASAYA